MFKQVTRPKHQYGERRTIPPDRSPTGHEQIEKRCIRCALVCVTVIGVEASEARQWRWGEDGEQFFADMAPWCRAEVEAQAS